MEAQPLPAPGASVLPATSRALWTSALGAFMLLVVLAVASLVTVGRTLDAGRDAREAVERHRETLEQLLLVFSALQDAETGQRGYVITGDPAFLEPYEIARQTMTERLAELDVRLEDPQSRQILTVLAETVAEQLSYYAGIIEMRDREGPAAVTAVMQQLAGKRRMDLIRDQVAQLRTIQEGLLRDRLIIDVESAGRSERLVQGLVLAAVIIVLLVGVLLLQDIRRRQRSERDLSVSNTLLSATMNSVSQGIGVFDRDLKLSAWNRQFIELMRLDPIIMRSGLPLDELLKACPALRVEARDKTGGLPAESLLDDFHRQPLIAELHAEDGCVLEARGLPTEDGNYILTYTDITPLKRSELAYRDQAVRLTATLDNVVDAIITINESGSIESWSKGAERLFGYTAEEAIRRNVNILMPEPHSSAHDSYLRRYIITGEKRIIGSRRAVEAKHRDGHLVPVDLGISEMMLGDRRLFIGVVRDITERLAVERLKNEFVSTVSHELRTPLTSISGALGLLSGGVAGAVPPKAERLVDIAKQNSDRLVRLINDILDLEKAESGRLEFQFERQPLRPIVAAAVEANRGFGAARQVRIEMEPSRVDGLVQVDRDRLIQVLTNLLSNAIKFSPEEGVVRVSISRAQDALKVSVRDEGPGIPPEFRSRIFQKFAQADSSDSRAKGGTGLGLSIAQTLIERLGGSIGFDTPMGGGTTFHISLPEWREATIDHSTGYVFGSGSKILICEDDPDIATILVELMRKATLNTMVVHTAHAAKEMLAQDHFDVALIDLNLPDADGLELIATLRQRPDGQRLPVIVMTARQQDGHSDLLHSLQLVDWLPKPVDPQRLMNAIHCAINGDRTDRYRILHVEDDGSLAEMLRALLEAEASVRSARSLADAKHWLDSERYDLVILDVALSDGSGLEILPLLRDRDGPSPPVVLYSATEASREVANQVEAALVKSRDSLEQLLATVRKLAGRKETP